jgi:hypothetical protein
VVSKTGAIPRGPLAWPRRKVVAAVMLLGTGCMVESPAAEPAVLHPRDMTQGQRLDTVGAASQWHYRLQPQYVLEVTSRHGSEPPRTSRLSLHDTKVELGHDAHAHRYEVGMKIDCIVGMACCMAAGETALLQPDHHRPARYESPGASRRKGSWCASVLAAMTLLCSSCVDSYPSEDTPNPTMYSRAAVK